MHRRNIITAAFAAAGALVAAATKTARANPEAPDQAKVVYHLCDFDKVSFVLGNIKNHFDGVGGPEHVAIALVVHGPPSRPFTRRPPALTPRDGPSNSPKPGCS
ncbi:MAG: hypothetical protein WCD82_25630 [Xanthobacteraceae bacterium]|jgi:hypothetical protein